MSQPTPYDRQFNFQNQAILTPGDPPPADEMDAEFNALKLTLDEILTNLAKIQRDDGALQNASVARETLNASIPLGFGAPTVWAHNTNYTAGFHTIFESSKFYTAAVTHLSDPSPLGFANDIANWTLIADFSAAAIQGLGTMSTQNANLVTITGGSIVGTAITVAAPDAAGKASPKSYVDASAATVTAYVDAAIAALSATLSGKLSAATGTKLISSQASAPVGWTIEATHNDKALRIVSGAGGGSGGTLAFTTVFAKTVTDADTPSIAKMFSHFHGGFTGNETATHTHGYTPTNNSNADPGSGGVVGNIMNSGVGATVQTGTESIAHTHPIPAEGGGASHSHGMAITVQYLDAHVIVKD